jgi:hypothetical protein
MIFLFFLREYDNVVYFMYNMNRDMDLNKVVKIGLISGITIIGIIAITNMLFPSNAINLHEQACMSLANQMIENMEESNFDTEKFAKINDLLFSRMTNEQCTDTEGWKKIVSYSPET